MIENIPIPMEEKTSPSPPLAPKGSGRLALVLSGGGIPGWAYEIGCLAAMDDFFDGFSVNDFDIYVGTSAGAAVAALMANNIRPIHIYHDILRNRKTAANFSRRDIYSFAYWEMLHSIKKLFLSLYPIAKHYLGHRGPFSLLELWEWIEESLPSGIYSMRNYDRYLSRFLSQPGLTNDFRALKKELYIPAVDLDIGRYDIFGEPGWDDIPISRAVIASSAIPIFFEPVEIRNRYYIDGGVGRVAYMDIAINHGAELIWVIDPVQYFVNDGKARLRSYSGKPVSIKEKGYAFIYDQAMRINSNTRIYFATKRYRLEYPEKSFLLIQPKLSEGAIFPPSPVGFSRRTEMMQYGYTSTCEFLREQFSSYEGTLKKFGIRVTMKKFKTPKK